MRSLLLAAACVTLAASTAAAQRLPDINGPKRAANVSAEIRRLCSPPRKSETPQATLEPSPSAIPSILDPAPAGRRG